MTCQHCQTWVLDEDHRCRRCGRRLKTGPARISPQTYPIAATATAAAYDHASEPMGQPSEEPGEAEATPNASQQALFANQPRDSRVVSFNSLNTEAGREAIRARAAELSRPTPVKTGQVQVRRTKVRRRPPDQPHLDFFGHDELLIQPQSNIICDAPVAPASLRIQAGIIDGLLMAIGAGFGVAIFRYFDGEVSFDKQSLLFLLTGLITVPLFYKLLWTIGGTDTVGIRSVGLRLVDFDGNPPSHERRYQRLFGSMISLLAAGLGMIWVFLDQDCLSWHDHMSSTFPTIPSES